MPLPLVATPWQRDFVASGTIYRRETPSGASSWVAHATWQEGGKRRQSKRSFRTKKEAQAALTELLAAHQTGTFVAPSRMPLRDFVEPWLAALANQGRKPTTLHGRSPQPGLRLRPHRLNSSRQPTPSSRATSSTSAHCELSPGPAKTRLVATVCSAASWVAPSIISRQTAIVPARP